MRLDRYLQQRGLAKSREWAKRLILEGQVLVAGEPVLKPAFEVAEDTDVLVTAPAERFVGRGGEKLEGALALFGVDPAGLAALDIGASTGGFADCLLQHGARSVVALDAGCGQLHPRLRDDPRVQNIEKYNARDLTPADVGVVDLAVMDVSFISQTYILPRIPNVLTGKGRLISLIKPQFEAGRAALNKQGIVRDEKDHILSIARVLEAAKAAGLSPCGLAPSPIRGGDGNREYLALFEKNALHQREITPLDIEKTVKYGEVILCKILH